MKINEYWERFASGEQWTHYGNGKSVDDNKNCWWEERPVYNIIQRYVDMVGKDSREELFKDGGIISKLAPYQKMYNSLKAKGMTLLNKQVYETLVVEDGSIDIDGVESEGFPPGKVLVYRQGAKAPSSMVANYKDSYDFIEKECTEIVKIMDGMWLAYVNANGAQLKGVRNE